MEIRHYKESSMIV